MPIIGVIGNMSGYVCPNCGHGANVLRAGAGEVLAKELDVKFLGRIPLHQSVAEGSDGGTPYVISDPDCAAAIAFQSVVDNVETSMAKLAGERSEMTTAE